VGIKIVTNRGEEGGVERKRERILKKTNYIAEKIW